MFNYSGDTGCKHNLPIIKFTSQPPSYSSLFHTVSHCFCLIVIVKSLVQIKKKQIAWSISNTTASTSQSLTGLLTFFPSPRISRHPTDHRQTIKFQFSALCSVRRNKTHPCKGEPVWRDVIPSFRYVSFFKRSNYKSSSDTFVSLCCFTASPFFLLALLVRISSLSFP